MGVWSRRRRDGRNRNDGDEQGQRTFRRKEDREGMGRRRRNAPVPEDHSSYDGRAQQSLTTACPPAALISSAMTLSAAHHDHRSTVVLTPG